MTDIERIKKAAAKVREGMDLFSQGPLDYDLTNLVAAYQLLISRFAPFKVGECVELAKTPEITEKVSWGWMSAKHYLKEGARGVVRQVSCGERGFSFYVSFECESWINDRTKEVNPKPHEHRYHFREDWLREAPADCDSEATSLEPGASERDAKKGAGSTPDETLREALAELVACKDLKHRFQNIRFIRMTAESETLAREYDRRQPLAWAAARRALATPTKPEMQSVHPAAASGNEEKR